MKAVWALRAKESKSKVAAYIRKEFENQRAKKFRQDINNTIALLLSSPCIGQIDPLFEGRAKT